MRLSVWQQFSSNHSAHFTVIGVFENEAKAQNAAEELRSILSRIERWHRDNPEKARALYDEWAAGEWPPSMSEIETELAKQYDVNWKGGVDWYWQANISVVLNRLVVLEPEGQVDWGPAPFDRLMERLGGQGLVYGYDMGGNPFGEISLHLSCEAPDEATAEAIVKAKASEYLEVYRYDKRVSFNWQYEVGFDLPEMIAYLKSQKCTDIHYALTGKTYIETDLIAAPDDEGDD